MNPTLGRVGGGEETSRREEESAGVIDLFGRAIAQTL